MCKNHTVMEQVLPTVFQKRGKIQGDQLREAELTAPVLSVVPPCLMAAPLPQPTLNRRQNLLHFAVRIAEV